MTGAGIVDVDLLKSFLLRERVREISVTSETSDFYAHILKGLRQKGKPIPTNDIWIAAQAMENGSAVATSDRHFEEIDGLVLDLI